MAAPSGNTFTPMETSDPLYKDLTDLCAVLERISNKVDAGVVGYSNGAIANTLAAMTYSNTGNHGVASGRYAASKFTYNACTTIQALTSCVKDVTWANT